MKTRRLASALGVLVAAAGVAGVAGAPASRAAGPAGQSAPTPARVWLTSPDGVYKLTGMGAVPFTAGSPTTLGVPAAPAVPSLAAGVPPADEAGPVPATSAVPTIVVDPTRSFQTMSGFGGAITDSSAAVLYSLTPAVRRVAMRLLFSPRTGIGLSYLRQPIGGSDFVATAPYTYDDLPPGQTDFAQRHFSIAHDRAQIIPLLLEAQRLNPKLGIVATPWSPPAWMKTRGSLIGGRLIDDPRIYRAYALYLLKFLLAYRAAGIRVEAITVQNEPQNRTPSGYPGTDVPSWQEAAVIEDL